MSISLQNVLPGRNVGNVDLRPDIAFDLISDAGGVLLSTVRILVRINSNLQYEYEYSGSEGANKYPTIAVTGDSSSYSFRFRFFLPGVQSDVRFDYDTTVSFAISAYEDGAPGVRFEEAFGFQTKSSDIEFEQREKAIWTTTADFSTNLEYGLHVQVDSVGPEDGNLRLVR